MAIAFDVAEFGGNSGATSLTWSHTCTGSNLVLVVTTLGNVAASDDVTGITYNGIALTKADGVRIPSDRYVGLWSLTAPATGAHNIVVSFTGNFMSALGASYTGCKQSGQPDAHTNGTVSSNATATQAITTIANNCWIVAGFGEGNGRQHSAGTATTQRADSFDGGFSGISLADSNAAKSPAGSYSLQTTVATTTPSWGVPILSLAPAVASTNSSFLAFM